jgi:Na+/proline symporter
MISSIFTRDLKNYTQKYSDESMKKLTRFFMLLFVVVTVIVAIFYQNIIALGLSMGSLSLALFPAILGSFYWKLKERAVFWSLFLSFVSVIIIFIADKVTPENAIISLPVVLISLIILQKILKHKELNKTPNKFV